MSLYQFQNNQLTRLKAIPFKVEKEIQRLVEENTEVLLGLTFFWRLSFTWNIIA
ncbi:hypothetical protein [Holzapfeliella floricola]|uniref:hypothetical protein n=1 Tax=Holzapfeliella floricola TaxID=679249 RepID=UPI001A911079|nr:hypothetical protein [Holzapfeliella floricola]